MEVRRRSDEVPVVAKAEKVPEDGGISEEIMMAIAEDAKFTELVVQAEETMAQNCKCDKPKEVPKVAQEEGKASKEEPKAAKEESKVAQEEPKVEKKPVVERPIDVPAGAAEIKKEEVVEKPKAPVSVSEFKKSLKDKEKKARLLAGDTPPPHEFPWLVMIQVVGKQPVAGGALITDRHVLTAASPLIG